MRAKLEYIVGNVRVPLEAMEFESLDEFTYNKFDTVQDIIDADKYKGKIGHLPKDGYVVVTYNSTDIPVHELDKYSKLGGNPMAGEEAMTPLVHSRGIAPSLRGVRKRMAKFINSPEVAEEFYGYFKDEYTQKETLDHLIGMAACNSQYVSNGIRRVMMDYTSGYEGYFMGRAFIERLSSFESVKKSEKSNSHVK